MADYKPGIIEPKWQKYWAAHDLDRSEKDPSRPKYYVLEMFPILRGNCIWVICVCIPSVMCWPVI